MQKAQVPSLITILMNEHHESYEIHFRYYLEIYAKARKTIEEFIGDFPGNTSDFSGAMRKGFFKALDNFCLSTYGKVLSESQKQQIYRYCEVHFERNLRQMSNISQAVHPSKKQEFRERVRQLLKITDFSSFYESVSDLIKEYPLTASWFKWYLHNDVATILFPACKNLDSQQLKRFKKLKKDTNAQEGIGGFLQSIALYKKDGLYQVLQTIFSFVSLYDRNALFTSKGLVVGYSKTQKQDKKRGQEPAKEYKGPDSHKRLLRTRRKTKQSKEDQDCGPQQKRASKEKVWLFCCYVSKHVSDTSSGRNLFQQELSSRTQSLQTQPPNILTPKALRAISLTLQIHEGSRLILTHLYSFQIYSLAVMVTV